MNVSLSKMAVTSGRTYMKFLRKGNSDIMTFFFFKNVMVVDEKKNFLFE